MLLLIKLLIKINNIKFQSHFISYLEYNAIMKTLYTYCIAFHYLDAIKNRRRNNDF